MKRYFHRFGYSLLALALSAGIPALAAPEKVKDSKTSAKDTKTPPKNAKESSSSKPETHTVKKGPFKIEITLDGVFEAQEMTEMVLRPRVWSGLSVLRAVEHGARVKQGDLLVALDLEKIDRAITDLRLDLKLARVGLKTAQEQLRTLEKSTPLDLARNERAKRIADEDLKHYLKVRPLAKKSTHYMLEMARNYLEYQQEELRQLEKMYKADDLTEETEEIILKRAQRGVKRAKFSLEKAEVEHERALKFGLPRGDQQIKEHTRRVEQEWKATKTMLPLALKKAQLEFEESKTQQARAEEKLEKLLADRKAMTLKAPTGGVVYYGACVRGKFGGSSSITARLRRGATLLPNAVFMTIVKPRPMFIRATVAEKQLQHFRAGVKGTAKPTGYPELKLTAIVDRVDTVPMGSGGFDSRITVALDRRAGALMPGMTCKVKLVPYQKKKALTGPPQDVSTGEDDDRKHYVYLVRKKGKPKKRYVTLGKRNDKQVEILRGLSEGNKVLLEPPKKK